MEKKRILLLYTDRYYLVKQIYPFGLDLIANYLREGGYAVSLDYPFLPDPDVESNLGRILEQTSPHFVGLGIRNSDTCMACEEYGDYRGKDYSTFWFLQEVKRIVDIIKEKAPRLPIIAGGGAFTVSPAAILKYLGIEYGVVGEGEEPLLQFVKAFPSREEISRIPGLACLKGDDYVVNPRQDYRFWNVLWPFGRERKFNYAFEAAGLPVQVKRGCNQRCSYCVEPLIEGRGFVFREIDQVIEELKTISRIHEDVNSIFFVDTEFNLPDLAYCSDLVEKIIDEGLSERFQFSTQILPRPFGSDFAIILAKARFNLILTCDSFADNVLETNQVPYRQKDIVRTLEICQKNGIGCTVSMVFGLPGETYKTIDHSLEQMNRFPPGLMRRYEYTIGGRIYQGTGLCRFVEKKGEGRHLFGDKSEGYIEPYYFCSPEAPMKLKQYIERALGYSVAYENVMDETRHQVLALSYMVDQGRWGEVTQVFLKSTLPARITIYDYLFRRLTAAGDVDDARIISKDLLETIQDEDTPLYKDQIGLIEFYLSCLE